MKGNTITTLRRLAAIGAVVTALAGTLLATAGGATAANGTWSHGNGSCDPGEACFYYNSNLGGAVFDGILSEKTNYSLIFVCSNVSPGGKPPCTGAGKSLHNNAASVKNRSDDCDLVVYYNSGWTGSKQTIAPGTWQNLNSNLKNENASHKFVCPRG